MTFLQITTKKLQAWLTSLQTISKMGIIYEWIYLITTSPKVLAPCVAWGLLEGKQSMVAWNVLQMDKSLYACMQCLALIYGTREQNKKVRYMLRQDCATDFLGSCDCMKLKYGATNVFCPFLFWKQFFFCNVNDHNSGLSS